MPNYNKPTTSSDSQSNKSGAGTSGKLKPPITLQYRLGNEREFLEKAIRENHSVTVKRTNYSLKIETPRRKYFFGNGRSSSKRAFAGYNKILKDIKASGMETPDCSARDVKYWWFKDKTAYPERFFSVDINSAYPTALKNVGAITPQTFDFLQKGIDKIDRLRCVGMLATQKGIYHYEDGKLVDFEVDTSDYSGWFFMCCVIIGEVMDLCKRRYGDQVLHYWVDGIALTDDPWDCLCYIEHLGYQSKIEVIENCKLKNGWLTYTKDGKKKYLHLPRRVDITDEEVKRFISGHNGVFK